MKKSTLHSVSSALLLTAGLLASALPLTAQAAGGVALGATRVIYPTGEKQVSLPVINSSDTNTFLIQSWVGSESGAKSSDFILTPPLFVMHPKKENTLRIMYVGPALPADRETVFYLNSKAIPSVDKSQLKGNTLQIATQSVIKLFMRPKSLPSRSVDAPKTLTCRTGAGKVTVNNPSPYYVSLVQFYVGGQKVPNSMVPPKGSLSVAVPGGKSGAVSFQTVNDFGANTPKQTCAG
jgi:fimbrial chaperone protein